MTSNELTYTHKRIHLNKRRVAKHTHTHTQQSKLFMILILKIYWNYKAIIYIMSPADSIYPRVGFDIALEVHSNTFPDSICVQVAAEFKDH